ncbi:hypothetical protein [Bradyrhizobium sp.]|uniref:hypothetical protein n=1 Tax=Bradyrhizobium sp. TaxID=376 RepID=UPI00143175F3|nr:hypothetical protein [Bradyrhizobium sp.]
MPTTWKPDVAAGAAVDGAAEITTGGKLGAGGLGSFGLDVPVFLLVLDEPALDFLVLLAFLVVFDLLLVLDLPVLDLPVLDLLALDLAVLDLADFDLLDLAAAFLTFTADFAFLAFDVFALCFLATMESSSDYE